MSLSPIGSAVFELLSRKHTDRQTSYYFIVRICSTSNLMNIIVKGIKFSIIIQFLQNEMTPLFSKLICLYFSIDNVCNYMFK